MNLAQVMGVIPKKEELYLISHRYDLLIPIELRKYIDMSGDVMGFYYINLRIPANPRVEIDHLVNALHNNIHTIMVWKGWFE